MKLKIFILSLTIFMCSILNSQSIQTISPSIPTSPQAEAIKRYGEYGISYFTGIPDINIPLYEIKHRGYVLPLYLKYNPQPLKPGYNYDVFGYGWGISAGSCVSRTVEYFPDEQVNFRLETHALSAFYLVYESGGVTEKNWAHDKFSVTLPDGTYFDFVITRLHTQGGKIEYKVSNGRSVKISCNSNTMNIYSFTIIDEKGIKYTFDEAELPYARGRHATYISSHVAWYLTRIDLPDAPNDPIRFQYRKTIESPGGGYFQETALHIAHKRAGIDNFNKNEIIDQEDEKGKVGEGKDAIVVDCYETNDIEDYVPYFYRMKLLTSISFGQTYIDFSYADEQVKAPRNHVRSIRILDKGSLINEIALGMSSLNVYYPASDSNSKIARLDNVVISGSQKSHNPQIYKFSYLGSSLYFSGTDHWGYLNHGNGQYDIARFNFFVEFNPNFYEMSPLAPELKKNANDLCPYHKFRLSRHPFKDNREPVHPGAHPVLRKIQYPTGGYTVFEFENNRCLTSTDADGDYIHDKARRREIAAGGYRIRKITNYTSDNTVADTKCFRYGKLKSTADSYTRPYVTYPFEIEHTGLGIATVDPNILTYMSFSHRNLPTSVPNMILGLSARGVRESFFNYFHSKWMWNKEWKWECVFSSSNFRRILNGRPSVIYPEVTVYHGDIDKNGGKDIIGKTLYKYRIDYRVTGENDTILFESPQYFGNTLSYVSQKYLHNILDEVIDYSFTANVFRIKQIETYSWNIQNYSIYDYEYANEDLELLSRWATLNDLFTPKSYYLGNVQLGSKRTTIFDHTYDQYQTSEYYVYNNRNQVIRKGVLNSRGVDVITTRKYPEISSTGTTPDAVLKMVEKNMIAPVLQEETKTSSGSFYSSGYKIDYKEFQAGNNQIIMPEKLYRLNASANDYTLLETIVRYSDDGNPVEVVDSKDMHTVYIWCHSGRYIAAKIENADYAKVNSAIQKEFGTGVNILSSNLNLDESKLNNLRKDTDLKDAHIYTYTYKPSVGVASITDPRGVTTGYTYDPSNNLQFIRDHFGNLIQSFNYHYRP